MCFADEAPENEIEHRLPVIHSNEKKRARRDRVCWSKCPGLKRFVQSPQRVFYELDLFDEAAAEQHTLTLVAIA